jgi:ribosome recycling factor
MRKRMIKDILKDAEERMDKSLNSVKNELITIRTGRATPALLDVVKVDYYGNLVPLKQVANVAAPDARLLVVQVFDKNAVSSVEKAIMQSDLGLTPQKDGNLIRLPIPQLTEERRKELVKIAYRIAEEGKVAIRNIRRDANEMLKETEEEHEISEDALYRAFDDVQKLTDRYIEKIDEIVKQKEYEIMEE